MNRLGYKLRWVAVNVSRLLLAVTFVFSGLVKVVDPRGTQYKFDDYFQAFGWSEWIPGFLPLWLAVLLAVFEFCIGIYLFFGIRRRTTSWFFLLFMSVMTPLTFYLALADPVSDCGCFGDAVSLTNWGDVRQECRVVGLVCARFSLPSVDGALCFRTKPVDDFPLFYFFAFVLAGFCIYYLPVFDFRPYHIGVNLPPIDGGSGRRGGAGVSYDIRT